MAYTKVPLLSYTWPDAASYPPSIADFQNLSPVFPPTRGAQTAPGNVRIEYLAAPLKRDWFLGINTFPGVEVYSSIQFNGSNNDNHTFYLGLYMTPGSGSIFNNGYVLSMSNIPGVSNQFVNNFRRNNVIDGPSTVGIGPSLVNGDIVEMNAKTTAPGQLTISVLRNGVVVYTFVDNAPLVSPKGFSFGLEADVIGANLDIGAVEFGNLVPVSLIRNIPLEGRYIPLPYVKRG